MTRPLRIQVPGALYHVTSRGDRKELIYLDDTDRTVWLQILGDVCGRFDFTVHAFCQMGNHYHLLLQTLNANLSDGMRHLNGVYSQYFNRRHALVGHVFQGRYGAILVDQETYLLELARYIVLNPVRAKLVEQPQDWRWSSYNLMLAETPSPAWLETNALLSRFASSSTLARAAYSEFVIAGIGADSPFASTLGQLILGSDTFLQQIQATASPSAPQGIAKLQRSALVLPLQTYQQQFPDRDEAMARAYRSHAYTLSEIARHFGVALTTASRAVKKHG